MAFGHKSIPIRVTDDDPVQHLVIITSTEAVARGLGSNYSENSRETRTRTGLRSSRGKTTSTARLQDKAAIRSGIGFATDSDSDSDGSDDDCAEANTASSSNPFILSLCTVKKRKSLKKSQPSVRICYKRVRRMDSPALNQITSSVRVRSPSHLGKTLRITTPEHSSRFASRFRISESNSQSTLSP